jgi:hypothetical protein
MSFWLRTCHSSSSCSAFLVWINSSPLIKIDSGREIKGVLHQQTRYISDETVNNPSCYFALAREHWGIENQLHWHLDMAFREDACRARDGDALLNLSTIRKFALLFFLKDSRIVRFPLFVYYADTIYSHWEFSNFNDTILSLNCIVVVSSLSTVSVCCPLSISTEYVLLDINSPS